MAYGIVHHFAGGTKEQYEATLAAVHPDRDSLPEGQTFHAAGASAGGWTVVIPRRHSDAPTAAGHQGRVHHATRGDDL